MMSIIWATSLSPRPDRFINTVWPWSDADSRAIQASACADSSAGMIPSLRAISWNASITSASVTHGYSARPIDARYECSGPDTRVVEPGRDRLRLLDLAHLVLHEVAAHPVDDAGVASADGGSAGRFDADQPGVAVDEAGEDAHRVRSAADARHHDVGVATEQVAALLARLVADHPVELAHHVRVRVRPHHRSEAVVAVADRGHPVAHRLVDRVLERAAPALDRFDLGAEQAHPEHVERLPLDVDRTHVHLALEPHQRRRRGARHAVLAGTGLGDDAGLAHPLGEQRLAEHVVDLVRAGVVEVLALEQQADAELAPEVVALGEDRRPPGVLVEDVAQVEPERRVGPCIEERFLELEARRHQGLGDEPPAELAETAGGVGRGEQRTVGKVLEPALDVRSSTDRLIRRPSRTASPRRHRGTAPARRPVRSR